MKDPYYKKPRKRLRLDCHDYSQGGLYFVTICTNNREVLFADSRVAEMVHKYWNDIANKSNMATLDEYVVMPNHIHGILHIVGADLCVGPCVSDNKELLPRLMQWYKTQTTNAYLRGIKDDHWQPFNGKLWQRGYHDRIIRSDEELDSFRKYIRENPSNWPDDSNNPSNTSMSKQS